MNKENKVWLVNALEYMICFFALSITKSEYSVYCCISIFLIMTISFSAEKYIKNRNQILLLNVIHSVQICVVYNELNYLKQFSIYGTVSLILESILYLAVLFTFFCTFVFVFKVQWLFLINSICFGLFLVFSLPVKSAPDELAHIYTSYNLSNQILDIDDGEDVFSIREGDQSLLSLPIEFENSLEVMDEYYELSSGTLTDITLTLEKSNCLNGNIPAYVMSALGISVGRICNLNAFWTLTLGRFFNLAQYIVLVYFAITVMPYSKYLPMAVALLPIAMQQGMSYSYDSLVIALSIFVICGSLGYKYNDNLNGRQKLLLGIFVIITSCILFSLKSHSYIFIAISPIIIELSDKSLFKKFWSFIEKMILFGMFLLVIYMVMYMVFHLGPFFAEPNNPIAWKGGVQGYTIQYFFNKPLDFIAVFINTFFRFSPFYLGSSTSYDLGWLNIQTPIIFILLFLIICYLSTEPKCSNYLNATEKRYYAFSVVITIFCILFIFLISYTPKDEKVILGAQGRYFIPLFVPGFLVMSPKTVQFQKIHSYIPVIYSILIMSFSLFLITRF